MRLSCIVCYEIFSPSDNAHAASCGHILHYHCWITWLKKYPNCPECRAYVQTAHLLKLFFTFDSEEGDYSVLSSKYTSLKYDFQHKTKEVQTANAVVEKQRKEIEALRLQVQEWKTKVSELQKEKSEVDELIPSTPAYSALPIPPSSYLSVGFGAAQLSYPAPCYTTSFNDWRNTHSRLGGELNFQHTVSNVSLLPDGHTSSSPNYWIQNLPWKIRIIPRTKLDPNFPHKSDYHNRWLGFFLQCNGDDISTQWRCYATADLRILPQREGVPVFQRKIQHLYHHKESDWGFRHFVKLEEILNPSKGYIKDDAIVVEVCVVAGAPVGGLNAHQSGSCALTELQNDYRKRLRQY